MSLPPFPPDYRASGVLLHVTSLPSAYGIGDVGGAAAAWIDRLRGRDRAGGRCCRWGRPATAILRISLCRRSRAMGFS